MKNNYSIRALFIVSAFVAFASPGLSGKVGKPRAGEGVMTDDSYRPFLINRLFNYYGNNGDGSFNRYRSDNEGCEFLKGTGKHLVFEDGLMWGGYHKGFILPKIGGSNYRHGLQAGPLLQYGTATSDPVADDASLAGNRIYRVRPDINPRTNFADVHDKIASEEVAYISRYESYSVQNIYDQYIQDWNEWPASLGAPFVYGRDSNNVLRTSGPYNPRFDIPGYPGADQTLWYVANDENIARTANLSISLPIGLEIQRTIWGYSQVGDLEQTVFTGTLIINKSGAVIDSMYLLQFADPDIGAWWDDYVGCDSSRDMGYAYNGKGVDSIYETSIPAVGFQIVQGPVVPGSAGDTAAFHLEKRPGFRNLHMTSFYPNIDSVVPSGGPTQIQETNSQWYRIMKGLAPWTGAPIIDPTTGRQTRFSFSGDPVVAQDGSAGWVDAVGGRTPGDRRMSICTGPFTMAEGDTQEIVVALSVGLGADYLSSIAVLRSVADKVQSAYDRMTGVGPVMGITVPVEAFPRTLFLMQNFPNPFNPSTTIRYGLPERGRVTLAVFNMLGQQVGLLVNGVQEAGYHGVRFDGSGLASGVYFYRLEAGDQMQTKRFLLVK